MSKPQAAACCTLCGSRAGQCDHGETITKQLNASELADTAFRWVNRDAGAIELFLKVLAEHVPAALKTHEDFKTWLKYCAITASMSPTISDMFRKIRGF